MRRAFWLLLLLWAVPVHAQNFRVDGNVQTPNGIAVPGASVAVLSPQPANTTTMPGSQLPQLFAATASNTATVTSASYAAQQITFTLNTIPSDLVANSWFAVTGASPAGYNSTISAPWLVLAVVGNNVTVASLTNPGTWISGGTVATSVLPNPTSTDGNGHYYFYFASGTFYTLQIYGPPIRTQIYPDQIIGAGSGGTVGPGTPNSVTKFITVNTVGNSSGIDNNINPVQWPNGINTVSGPFTETDPNTTPGTVLYGVAKLVGGQITAATSSDANNIEGIVQLGAGSTGNAVLATGAKALCAFTNASTTPGDWVILDVSNPPNCLDTGSTTPTAGVANFGRVLTVNSGTGTTALVEVYTPGLLAGSAGGGNCTTPGTVNSVLVDANPGCADSLFVYSPNYVTLFGPTLYAFGSQYGILLSQQKIVESDSVNGFSSIIHAASIQNEDVAGNQTLISGVANGPCNVTNNPASLPCFYATDSSGGAAVLTSQFLNFGTAELIPTPSTGCNIGWNGTDIVAINTSGGNCFAGGSGSGTVTNIATTSPLGGGPITTTGTLTCTTCIVASSPSAGVGHFAGSTQTITSSAVSLTADVSGVLPIANGGNGTATTTAHFAFIGPTSGSGAPSFRLLATPDLPFTYTTTNAATLLLTAAGTFTLGDCLAVGANGNIVDNGSGCGTGGGGGTVTNVALAMTNMPCTISGSPVTTTGTLTCSANTETANFVWAGPASGSAATPTFRALVSADIPNNAANTSGNAATATLAATATALAATPAQCTGVNFATGITASGVANCSAITAGDLPVTLTSNTTGNASTATNSTKVGSITVTGTPAIGNVLTATSTTAATWQALPASGAITGSGTTACIPIYTSTTVLGTSPICLSSGILTSTDPFVATSLTSSGAGAGNLNLSTTTVSGLPTASSNPHQLMMVSDSTAISAEGQTCVGGSSGTALAFSNGVVWKCF
jgi:hypothetical protein